LKEYLTAGVSKDDFLKRLSVVLGSQGPTTASPNRDTSASEIIASATTTSVTQQDSELQSGPQAIPEASPPAEEPRSDAVQDLLAERSERLKAQKQDHDAKEKADRATKAKARREALEEAAPAGSKKSADMKYALMQKKRQQDARDERARILKRLEDDKAERREREALRKAQVKANEDAQHSQALDVNEASSGSRSSSLSNSTDCALQVRLFDGSTIRSRFSSQGTIRADVRSWIDAQPEKSDLPYTFKHVLTPRPNKNISISEEEESLQSLGLAPSATLILIPVQEYTSAYEGSATGLMSKGVSAGYRLVSSGVGMVANVLGSFLGGTATAPAQERQNDIAIATTPATAMKIRTLRDEEKKEQEFYNGNAVG
jgi:hypothetical protein